MLPLISNSRVRANCRATDQANMGATSKSTALVATKPAESGYVVVSPPQQLGTGSKFSNWTEICRHSGRITPTADDLGNRAAPRRFFSNPNGSNYADWMICKEMDRSARHRENLYEGHYGNYPTHCPRWSELNCQDRLNLPTQRVSASDASNPVLCPRARHT